MNVRVGRLVMRRSGLDLSQERIRSLERLVPRASDVAVDDLGSAVDEPDESVVAEALGHLPRRCPLSLSSLEIAEREKDGSEVVVTSQNVEDQTEPRGDRDALLEIRNSLGIAHE